MINHSSPIIDHLLDKLLAVLNKDIQHIQDSLSWLNELRSLVIKRDDVALSKLLQSIRAESDSYVSNERQRQSLRKDLANALGCQAAAQIANRKWQIANRKSQIANVDKRLAISDKRKAISDMRHAICDKRLTLSSLAAILPEEKKAQITNIKTKLRSLVEQLKREHLSTSLLLSDCARFNNLLLKAIFDLGKTGTVYNPKALAKRQTDTAFVSLRL